MSISVVPKEAQGNAVRTETISVIIPISERHDDIGEMHREYKEALLLAGIPFEMIYVVEGGFGKVYLELKAMKERGEKLTLIKHSRPFGEAVAVTSGFLQSTGGIIDAPAYHQVDAADLPKMIGSMGDHDMVVARRWPRSDSKWNQLQTRSITTRER
jgi:hypothetical protein